MIPCGEINVPEVARVLMMQGACVAASSDGTGVPSVSDLIFC
jgi:hypothetical protein